MNADGTDPQRLTYNNDLDGHPSWSPDGRYLAFASTRTENWAVFVIELATGNIRQLTSRDEDTDSASPDWSPDGTQIVFERFINIKTGSPRKPST